MRIASPSACRELHYEQHRCHTAAGVAAPGQQHSSADAASKRGARAHLLQRPPALALEGGLGLRGGRGLLRRLQLRRQLGGVLLGISQGGLQALPVPGQHPHLLQSAAGARQA